MAQDTEQKQDLSDLEQALSCVNPFRRKTLQVLYKSHPKTYQKIIEQTIKILIKNEPSLKNIFEYLHKQENGNEIFLNHLYKDNFYYTNLWKKAHPDLTSQGVINNKIEEINKTAIATREQKQKVLSEKSVFEPLNIQNEVKNTDTKKNVQTEKEETSKASRPPSQPEKILSGSKKTTLPNAAFPPYSAAPITNPVNQTSDSLIDSSKISPSEDKISREANINIVPIDLQEITVPKVAPLISSTKKVAGSSVTKNILSNAAILIKKTVGKILIPENIIYLPAVLASAAVGGAAAPIIGISPAVGMALGGGAGATIIPQGTKRGWFNNTLNMALNFIPGPEGTAINLGRRVLGSRLGVKQVAQKGLIAFFSTPLGWGTIGVIIFLFIVILITQQSSAMLPPYQVEGISEVSVANSTPGASLSPTNTPGSGESPIGYAIPIRDTSVIPNTSNTIAQAVQSLCGGQGYGEPHLELWQDLIQASVDKGWNPSFVSALWIEETGAQCPAVYDDAVGCGNDPNKSSPDAKKRLFNYALPCLDSFFTNWFPRGYSNDQFQKFMCIYADGPSGYPACNSSKYTGFISRVSYWYTKLSGNNSSISPTPTTESIPNDITGKINTINQQFHIDFSKFDFQSAGLTTSQYNQDLQWAWADLNLAKQVAPKFDTLLGNVQIELGSLPYNYRSGQTVNFSKNYYFFTTENFFKQNFIHELTHVINDGQPGKYGVDLWNQAITKEGYISQYSSAATPGDVSQICTYSYPLADEEQYMSAGNTNPNDTILQYIDARDDEDFSESVAYYITSFYDPPIVEMPYGNSATSPSCAGVENSTNPFTGGGHPYHTEFIKKILGGQ